MDSSKSKSETRRANIIYFLNRHGRIEHPHLIRVHHFCHSGVHLRDVKRWMSELRGEELPDSFAWSYQRRYKKGLVWQDLTDDDLLTPISDCEYVLLGSLISGAKSKSNVFISSEVKDARANEKLDVEESVLQDKEEEAKETRSSPAKDADDWSYQRKPLHVLRNFLTCRAVDTIDNVLVAGGGARVFSNLTKTAGPTKLPLRLQNSHMENNNKRKSEPVRGGKSSGKAGRMYMPRPKCSQCGKPFNPEKLHAHMKACKGIK